MLENLDINPLTLLMLPVILFALSVHEAAHALVADRGGDDTARLQGRVTLNPLSHIDPIGTILVPIVLMISSGYVFGWARPVPVQPHRLKNGHWFAFVAAAGPISNLMLAVIAYVVMFATSFVVPVREWHEAALNLGVLFILINLILMVFNLFPIPPLDGSKIFFQYVVSGRPGLYKYWEVFEQIGFMLVFMLIMIPGVGKIFSYVRDFTFFLLSTLTSNGVS